jgi:D-3-phosphoglycerate dehydrogenase / 2-oxoglutarate reductase
VTTNSGRVLLTDHPWPDAEIETRLCAEAGYELLDAPPRATSSDLASLAVDVDGILTCWSQVTRDVVEASTRLRVISRLGVGLDNIDLDAAREHHVTVTRVPDYCVEEVSDHALALILNWARGISYFDRFSRSESQLADSYPLRRVRDLVVGIWGAGHIGLRTARKISALGCTVLIDNHHPDQRSDFASVPIAELLSQSDVISLHMPLTSLTKGLVNEGVFNQMKRGSLLVNTSRGALVDVEDLASGLDRGRPAAAALDVLPNEPHIPARLVGRDNVVITPHVAFSSAQSIQELRERATANLVRALRGEPIEDAIEHPRV